MGCGGFSKPNVRLCHFDNSEQGAIHIFPLPAGYRAQPTFCFNNFFEQAGLIRIDSNRGKPNDLDINATNNYWGGLSIDEIDRLIWDKNDVTPDLAPYFAEVNYLPMEASEIDSAGLP
jgi:hypothetical protein